MADRSDRTGRNEGRAVAEFAALLRDPVYHGVGVPRGDGRPVLVVPGLFGTDHYLRPLRHWLRRIGYRPVRSSLSINAGCPERLTNQVEAKLARILASTDQRVALIGHSRGGMLSWALASRLGERASHLILAGSPAPAVVAMMQEGTSYAPGDVAHRNVTGAGARALKLLDPHCTVPDCGCPYVEDMRRPLHPSTRVVSFWSEQDEIVQPAACHVPDAENIHVGGTHSGLAHNRRVYPHLGRILAEAH